MSTTASSEGSMVLLEKSLDLKNRTVIWHEPNPRFDAPHHFSVYERVEGRKLGEVHFQEGPINEHGVNGVTDEDLLYMVKARMEGWQKSQFACRENAVALTHLDTALLWLAKRTIERTARGVEGTHQV